jgi:lipoyl(octanoyl) transferase
MRPRSDPAPLDVYLLGSIDFADAQHLQRRLVYDLGEGGGGALVLCEHVPTITVGRSGSRAHIGVDEVELRELGIRVHWVSRGGGCVLHIPGQLVGYLVLPLDRLGLDLGEYLACLDGFLLGVLEEFDLRGETRPDLPGAFLGGARVATVGVAVSRWIASHGFTLNVGPYLGWFDLIKEPGIGLAPLRQSSMEARRQRPAPMARVRETIIRRLEETFGLPGHHLFTDHSVLMRKSLAPALARSLG